MAVHLQGSTVANCLPEHVWERFHQIQNWPLYNDGIGGVRWVRGDPWQPGSELAIEILRPHNLTIEATIAECSPPLGVRWLARQMGVSGEQWFLFEAQPDGTTRLTTAQQLSGAVLMFMTDKMKQDGARVLQAWLDALKTDAERSVRGDIQPEQPILMQQKPPQGVPEMQVDGATDSMDSRDQTSQTGWKPTDS